MPRLTKAQRSERAVSPYSVHIAQIGAIAYLIGRRSPLVRDFRDPDEVWEKVEGLLAGIDWVGRNGWAPAPRQSVRTSIEGALFDESAWARGGNTPRIMSFYLIDPFRIAWGLRAPGKGRPPPTQSTLVQIARIFFLIGRYVGAAEKGVDTVPGFPTAPLFQIGHFVRSPDREDKVVLPAEVYERLLGLAV